MDGKRVPMSVTRGDLIVERMAERTGLNPVLCAQWMALHGAFMDALSSSAWALDEKPALWTLQGWQERNAAETMAAMKPEPVSNGQTFELGETLVILRGTYEGRKVTYNGPAGLVGYHRVELQPDGLGILVPLDLVARPQPATPEQLQPEPEPEKADEPFKPGDPLFWNPGPFDSVPVNYRAESPSGLHWVDLPANGSFPLGQRQSVMVEARHLSRPPKAEPAPVFNATPEAFTFGDEVVVLVNGSWKRGRFCGPMDFWFFDGFFFVRVDAAVIAVPVANVRIAPPAPGKRVIKQMMQKYIPPHARSFLVREEGADQPMGCAPVGEPFEMTCEVPL